MKIKKGMKFRDNVNRREIEIIKADNQIVQYRDCRYGTVFTFTIERKAFERWNITEVN